MLEKIVWLALGILVAVFLCLRLDVIHFSQFSPVFVPAMLIAFIAGLVLFCRSIVRHFRKRQASGRQVVSGLIGVLPLLLLLVNLVSSANKYPAIHDITTDLDDPPQFHLAKSERVKADNPVEYDPANIPIQMESYPGIKSLQISASREAALEAVNATIKQMGWQVLGVTETNAWQLEAVAQTPMFGFRDDVVIRVTEKNVESHKTTIIDVRSASRVGLGDIGANANRIYAFFETLKKVIDSRG